MNLEQKFKEETGFDVGKIHDIGTTYYSNDYVEWLEKQLSMHVVSTRLLADCRNHYLLGTDFETGEPKASMQELLDHWKDVNTQLNID